MISNFILVGILSGLFAGIGIYIGLSFDSLRKRLNALEDKLKEKPVETGVTLGAYKPASEGYVPDMQRKAGIVEAKTPQRVAWEAQQALEQEARGQ